MTRTFILLLIALVSTRAHAAQWELLPDTDSTRVSRLASDGIRLYAASYRHGLFISEDDGATWRHTGLPSAWAIGISDDAVYVFCDRLLGMFRSDDRGESWAPKNVGLAEPDEDDLVEGDITHHRARPNTRHRITHGDCRGVPRHAHLPRSRAKPGTTRSTSGYGCENRSLIENTISRP